jgi:hypothetical protein
MTAPSNSEPVREDVHALAEAFVKRMTWPSMHWRTHTLDFDAAVALALVALNHAPDIIAAARTKEYAIARILEDTTIEAAREQASAEVSA